jgi:esterase/lipase superfamily enzyme
VDDDPRGSGDAVKATGRWWSERLREPIGLARWGSSGTPVLVFPTAGGDAEEIERNGLIGACRPLVEAGRVTIYSCDSVAGRALVAREGPAEHRMALLDGFQQCVVSEVVPAIRADLGGAEVPVVAAGASIGAFTAVAVLCRYPEVFRAAVAMSGTYRLQPLLDGGFSDSLYFASPLDFLPGLDGARLETLRQRFVLLASGQGEWEDVGESWAMAEVLGRKGVPNRVDPWGPEWPHEWHTWHRMLPQYLDELC